MDFTVDKYEELILLIKEKNIPTYTILEWLEQQPDAGMFIRHDVDRVAINSLEIATLEHQHGIKSTYYFRIVKESFKPEIINRIAELGHEIGYHYEDLSIANGDYEKAIDLFEKHLGKVRSQAPVQTIAMHGRPLSKYDNRDLWKKFDIIDFDLKGEAFLSIDYSDIYYFTDTGRNWDMHQNNLRDKTASKPFKENVKSTEELMQFLTAYSTSKFALITHPERWNNHRGKWIYSYSMDNGVNLVKKVLKAIR